MAIGNTSILIKRSTTLGTPVSLQAGELGYSYLSNTIFIGSPSGTGVVNVGGQYYTSQIDAATSSNTVSTIVKRDAAGNVFLGHANVRSISFSDGGTLSTGAFSGNANSATQFQTDRYIDVTGGDITASAQLFNGTANATLSASLNSVAGLSAGTYGGVTNIPVVTVAANGRVMAIANTSIATSLSIAADTGTDTVHLANNTLTFTGGEGITSAVTDNAVSFGVDTTVVRANTPSLLQTIDGDLILSGNLSVLGTSTTYNVTTLTVEDSLIALAKNNTSDAVDIGFYGHYNNGADRHAGLMRHAGDGYFYLFDNYDTEPTGNVINVASASFRQANLKSNLVAAWANTTVLQVGTLNVAGATTLKSLTLTEDLEVPSGGTGASSFTAGSILVGDGSNSLKLLANSTYTETGSGAQNNTITSVTVDAYGRTTAATFSQISGLTVGQGGTGVNTFSAGQVIIGNGSGALVSQANVASINTNVATSNTTGTANVFAITTNMNAGVYNNANSVNNTTIQTRNSNPRLILEANSTGQYDSNRISLGFSGNRTIATYPGPQSPDPWYGTTVIGAMSGSVQPKGLTGNLSTFATFPSLSLISFQGTSGGWNEPNHALSIVGVQTIGTTDPVSLLGGAKSSTGQFGAISMLKIHRNLGNSVYVPPSSAYWQGITGAYPFNYPNGLEITSFKSQAAVPGKGNENKSVALAIGATKYTAAEDNERVTCPATGFYVSDTGENVAIGTTIDNDAVLAVSGAAAISNAILAYGDVNVTGGNLNVTNGDVNVTGGDLNVTGSISFNIDQAFNSTAEGPTGYTLFRQRSNDIYLYSEQAKGATTIINSTYISSGGLSMFNNQNITLAGPLKMIRDSLGFNCTVTGMPSSVRYLSSFSSGSYTTNTTSSITYLGPYQRDVIIYGMTSSGTSPSTDIYVEDIDASNFYILGRANGGGNSWTAIVPADCQFYILLEGTGNYSFRVCEFGRVS